MGKIMMSQGSDNAPSYATYDSTGHPASRRITLHAWKQEAREGEPDPQIRVWRLDGPPEDAQHESAPHRHDYFELYVVDGESVFTSDFEEFRLRGPAAVFVNEGAVHSWKNLGMDGGYRIAFTRSFVERSRGLTNSPFTRYPFVFNPVTRPMPLNDTATAGQIMTMVGRIHRETGSRGKGWETIVRSALHMILSDLARIGAELPSVETGGSLALVTQEFRLLVEKHFREDKPISFYCLQLRISQSKLSAATRAMTGLPPTGIIRDRTMLEAKRLLQHSRLNVAEISDLLGIEDSSYFCRIFRKQTGMAPMAYRKSLTT